MKRIKRKHQWIICGLIISIGLIDWVPVKPCTNVFSETFQVLEKENHELAFVADTQDPMRTEKLFLKQNHNLKATEMIFKDIDQRDPSALFVLGDLISLSCKEKRWKTMDEYLAVCRQSGIPVYALLGNHEFMFNASKGERNFQQRFPEHVNTGYVEVFDSIAVVLLNSNFSKLTKKQIDVQQKFLEENLNALDNNAAIKYIVVACHHSPYSNSKVVGSSIPVQQKFVPLFIKSKKCKLFLSGHSHNFEYFKHEGKDFLVIGGGGGLHQPLREGASKLPDLAPDYKPMFHYLTLRRFNDHLLVTSHKLKEDFSACEEGFALSIQ